MAIVSTAEVLGRATFLARYASKLSAEAAHHLEVSVVTMVPSAPEFLRAYAAEKEERAMGLIASSLRLLQTI